MLASNQASAANRCAALVGAGDRDLSAEQRTERIRRDLTAFIEGHSVNAALVSRVRTAFRESSTGADFSGRTDVLVISLNGLDAGARAEIRSRVVELTGPRTVSFPLKNGESHLFTRAGGEVVYDFDYRWPTTGEYAARRLPENWNLYIFENNYGSKIESGIHDQVLEPIVSLSEHESLRFQTYLSNVRANIEGTIGRFNFEGTVYSSGRLERNVPPRGTGNNCTSWVMNAPVGVSGESFLSLLGPRTRFNGWIGTNPGWLLGYVLTQGNPQRVPVTILWTHEPLETARRNLETNGLTQWNFAAQ